MFVARILTWVSGCALHAFSQETASTWNLPLPQLIAHQY